MKLQARNFVVRKPETIDITMFFKKFCIATRTKSVTVVDTISTTVIFYFPLVLGAYRMKMGVFRSFSALTGCTAPSPQPVILQSMALQELQSL